MRDLLESASRIEAGSELVGEGLVVNEAVCSCRVDSLLVEALGIKGAAFDAGDLRSYQCDPGLEILRAILRPERQLLMMFSQGLQMLLLRPVRPDFRLRQGFGGQVGSAIRSCRIGYGSSR